MATPISPVASGTPPLYHNKLTTLDGNAYDCGRTTGERDGFSRGRLARTTSFRPACPESQFEPRLRFHRFALVQMAMNSPMSITGPVVALAAVVPPPSGSLRREDRIVAFSSVPPRYATGSPQAPGLLTKPEPRSTCHR
jgi:hypothetical protein